MAHTYSSAHTRLTLAHPIESLHVITQSLPFSFPARDTPFPKAPPFLSLWNTKAPHFLQIPILPMAPATTSSAAGPAQRLIRFNRRTSAPRRHHSPPPKKFKPLAEVMERARFSVVERTDYSDVRCEQCGSGDRAEELLLCDKCDRGFHMKCLRPIVAILPIGSWLCPKCSGQRRVRSRDFVFVQCVFAFPSYFVGRYMKCEEFVAMF